MKQNAITPHELPSNTSPEAKSAATETCVILDQNDLLTRSQAAEYLGISIFQFDTLKKRAKIKTVRSTDEYPTTNAKTRPFSMYGREDVDKLRTDAERLRNRSMGF